MYLTILKIFYLQKNKKLTKMIYKKTPKFVSYPKLKQIFKVTAFIYFYFLLIKDKRIMTYDPLNVYGPLYSFFLLRSFYLYNTYE